MRKPRILVTLLGGLLLAACATAPETSPDAQARAPADDASLSLVTFNLYHDKADWPQRLPLILAGLRSLHPDVIALQEVLQHEGLPNQAQTIAEALGYRWYFVSIDPPGQTRRYGNAILVRHPILLQQWRRLRPLDDSRSAGLVRIAVNGRPLNVYVTHLHYKPEGGDIRAQQVRDLRDFIADTRGDAPVIVAGDFNAPEAAPELAPLASDYINAYGALHAAADADPRASSTLNLSYFAATPARIDHVWLQRGAFVPIAARIILNRPDAAGHWPSDHYGMYARFRLDAAAASPGRP